MLAHRSVAKRGFLLARIQHSQSAKSALCPRLFARTSQLRVVSQAVPRPQLPYLHPSTVGRLSAPRGQAQNQLIRFMSSDKRRYFQSVLERSLVLTAAFVAFCVLYAIVLTGLDKEIMERKFPAPYEWKWKWRYQFSKAAANQIPDASGRATNWPYIASQYLVLLKILEDPAKGGKDLRPILDSDGDIYVDGIGKAGMDLSEKSEPWRRGYHACLMGAAKAVEHVDGWVNDTTRNIAFPPQFIIGPSNPAPKPVPMGAEEAPLEENCVPAFPGPDALYIKILTSHGFTSGQRLEAAVAYADWLDFKGLSSTAEEMYDWGLDIATGALPVGVNNIVDLKTGIINSKATYISSNVLTATTALARHHARNSNLAAALPIFLSILRARRHLLLPEPPKAPPEEESLSSYLFSMAKSWLIFPPYPPPPPTGDEAPSRTPAAVCEEAAIMAHIGEILFASSSFKSTANVASDPVIGSQIPTASTTEQLQNFQSGLSWTRDAVDLAEETLISVGTSEADQEARTKCTQCLSTGMENWSTMVEKMLQDERAAKASAKSKSTGSMFWGSKDNGNDNQNRWEGEARIVDSRSRRIGRMLMAEADRELPLWMRILGKVKDV